MNAKQLILKSAITTFTVSTVFSGTVFLWQTKANHPNLSARLASCFSMMGTGLTMFIGSRIEAAQFEESLKPRPVPLPC